MTKLVKMVSTLLLLVFLCVALNEAAPSMFIDVHLILSYQRKYPRVVSIELLFDIH